MAEALPDTSSRPAFYALRSGGWRDYWTLLHPPYTAWHLSYVVFGAVAAPHLNSHRLGWSVLGFFLGVGLTAHALDELRGARLPPTARPACFSRSPGRRPAGPAPRASTARSTRPCWSRPCSPSAA